MVSRTGFTGDLGYELWIDAGAARSSCGTRCSPRAPITASGRWARMRSRSRASRPASSRRGVDFHPADQAIRLDRSRSPFELDLGRLVDFKKPIFNGRRALLEEQKRGSRFRFVRLDIEGNKPAQSLVHLRQPQGTSSAR